MLAIALRAALSGRDNCANEHEILRGGYALTLESNSVLRDLIKRFAGKAMTLADLRQALLNAAPKAELPIFFARWLDRAGAPILDVKMMYDRETESWWQQVLGEAIAGELTGAKLTQLPARIISFGTSPAKPSAAH